MKAATVAIVGGGPAGAATALALAQHAPELPVVLLEAEIESPRFSETLAPNALPLLEALGVGKTFEELHCRPAPGTVSTWGLAPGQAGGQDGLTTLRGPAWHLDRRTFDAMLVAAAGRAGCRVVRSARVLRVKPCGQKWQLDLRQAGASTTLESQFVVDATGRRAFVATGLGARRVFLDRQIALHALFAGGQPDERTLIETTAEGWFYGCRLPSGESAVVFLTDGDVLRAEKLRDPTRFVAQIARTSWLAPRLDGARLVESPRVFPAASGFLDHCAGLEPTGAAWLAVGDAAFSLDPLAGQGLTRALSQAFWAAFAVADLARGQGSLALEKYQALQDAEIDPYLRTRDHFYRQERKWADSAFWQRRQHLLTLGPEDGLRDGRRPTSFPNFWLPRRDLERLRDLAGQGHLARGIVASFREKQPRVDPRRVLLSLQKLLEHQVLERY